MIGLGLAALIVGAWLALLGTALFVVEWSRHAWAAPLVIAAQTWLFVGMFIVAHDAIHGTLAPAARRLNRPVGALCVFLYAGFDFDALAAEHRDHHRFSGTARDPDFHCDNPWDFGPWFVRFFTHYFGWRQFAILAAATVALALALGERAPLLLLFWALPAILSSAQLFFFGTYLPHRHEDAPFVDHHNTRSVELPWLASLLTCFHFGHHHAHHAHPSVPWWRLPAKSAEAAAA